MQSRNLGSSLAFGANLNFTVIVFTSPSCNLTIRFKNRSTPTRHKVLEKLVILTKAFNFNPKRAEAVFSSKSGGKIHGKNSRNARVSRSSTLSLHITNRQLLVMAESSKEFLTFSNATRIESIDSQALSPPRCHSRFFSRNSCARAFIALLPKRLSQFCIITGNFLCSLMFYQHH
jgi:hypothetical protein